VPAAPADHRYAVSIKTSQAAFMITAARVKEHHFDHHWLEQVPDETPGADWNRLPSNKIVP
jgi:hypothetical protein